MCRREVRKKCIKSRRDSKSWRITTNLSGEKNRKRASPQETVILMKQTFEPFPLLSSTGNLKKGSQFSLNYKLPGRLLHRNQTALSDRLSHVSPVRCSVHYRGFWLSCMSICEWFYILLDFNLGFLFCFTNTHFSCVALYVCVWQTVTQIFLLSYMQTKHQLVCMSKFLQKQTKIFSLSELTFSLPWTNIYFVCIGCSWVSENLDTMDAFDIHSMSVELDDANLMKD